MLFDENFISASGIILSREISGENSLLLKLFLKGIGIINVTAKKSTGDTEPLVCGIFSLKKKFKGKSYSVGDIDVTDDMFYLRKNKNSIQTALNWTKLLLKYLILEQPDDELLANLFWNMKLLSFSSIPQEISNWRFIWKWLEIWGLAPDFIKFHISMNFSDDEIILLAKVLNYNTAEIVNLFSKPFAADNIRENIFKVASQCAAKLLYEK